MKKFEYDISDQMAMLCWLDDVEENYELNEGELAIIALLLFDLLQAHKKLELALSKLKLKDIKDVP